MNSLDQIIKQIRDSEKEAECTWTYRDACAQLLQILKEIEKSSSSPQDAGAARIRLAYCLRLARAVQERDMSLSGVVDGIQYLITCVDTSEDLASDSVQDAVEAVVLDVEFCISQHR